MMPSHSLLSLAAFMVAMARAEGDTAEVTPQPDGGVIVTRHALPLFRRIDDPTKAMQGAWEALMVGALAAWDRFASIAQVGPLSWRIEGG